jgi:hypothetical protein
MKASHFESYPLHWPDGFKRSKFVSKSRFERKTISISTDEVIHQVKLLGGRQVVISTNLKLKNDGLPYSSQKQPPDCGVAVYFQLNSNQRVLACDKWNRIEDNLWAIAKTVEAMRGIDRWGASELLDRIFTGFLALPEVATWKTILGLDESQNISLHEAKAAYYSKAKEYHPDNGGDPEKMSELNNAWQNALRELGG